MTQNKYNKGDQVQIANGDWFEVHNINARESKVGVRNGKGDFIPVPVRLITDHRPADDKAETISYVMAKLADIITLVELGDKKHVDAFKDLKNIYRLMKTRHPEGDITEEV